MKLVGYIRVSTEEQAKEGLSLDAQKEKISKYTSLFDAQLVDIVADPGVSAGNPLEDRSGGKRIIEMVNNKEVDGVVSLKLDRLFRNASDCLNVVEKWDKQSTSLHLIEMGQQAINTAGPMGKFFITIMAGVAELERNQIRERTTLVMQHMKEQGLYTGGRPPYGYKVENGRIVVDEKERNVINSITTMRDNGLFLKQIASELKDLGVLSRAGKPLGITQIQRILKRELLQEDTYNAIRNQG